MRKLFTRMQQIALGFGIAGVFALSASAANPAGRITGAVGQTTSGDQAVEMRGGLDENADLETGEDGNCAVLVDQDALVEMCGGTSLKLSRKGGDPNGPRVVNLDRGEIRMVVEPRLGEERIEIHTPAAIATILGTVLHVAVDALGVTTITSAANEILVQSNDPNVKGSTKIEPNEQLVIRPGEPPPARPTTISQRAMSGLGGCLIDFHAAALSNDRGNAADDRLNEVVDQDVADAILPAVEAGENQVFEGQVNDLQSDVNDVNTDPPNNQVDNLALIIDPLDLFPIEDDDCGVIPGRGCLPGGP